METKRPIYADYNATTPIDPIVLEEMLPYLNDHFGNPSSNHWYGNKAKEAVVLARQRVAECLGCAPHEVIFTSGGSESDNLAIKGIAFANGHHGNHIVTSAIEHPAVLEPCRRLEKHGFEVTYLPVDEYGMVSVDDLRASIRDETILITIMHANNEVGTIQPIAEIGDISKELGIYLHTDAAQSIGKIPVNVDDLGVDLLTIAGHKFYAPKGIGVLYVREGTEIEPLIEGGSQEYGLRAGTEAVAQIVAIGRACQLVTGSLEHVSAHMFRLRERLFEQLVSGMTNMKLNGHPTDRLPNTLNLGFQGVIAADLLAGLSEFAASPGAACHAESCELSHVLMAMGVDESYGLGAIRISLGKWSTEEDIDAIADILPVRYDQLLDRQQQKNQKTG